MSNRNRVFPSRLFAVILIGSLVISSCAVQPEVMDIETRKIDLQGHRGARGLLPENTIPGFLLALELGVDTLEMDVAINAEGHVVLSHEPWMSADICQHPDGRSVTRGEQENLKIYQMSDAEVASYDCGSRGHADFPRQKAMPVAKPLLADVLKAVAPLSTEVRFNIEIKSRPERDGVFHPEVGEYARLLYSVLQEHDVVSRSSIQSFDPRALEATHVLDPKISTVWLIERSRDFEKNLAYLSFVPSIYSPYYKLVNQALIDYMHDRDIQVIPWTVNKESTMRKLLTLGVDGLITDYPDLAVEVLNE
jgi:glycerophosphoryl diester phosphodiesterase